MSDRPNRAKHDTPFADDAAIAVLVEQFEACRWPYERWTHRAHLAVAVAYLRRWPLAGAADGIRAGFHLYTRTCCDPAAYHETVTRLFLRLVRGRLGPPGTDVALVD